MPRWLSLVIIGVAGMAAGLAYGWLLSPVKYVDTVPASMRIDYRADFVLMAAERFAADRDVDRALRELALLGPRSGTEICEEALDFGRHSSYSQTDMYLLEDLCRAMPIAPPTRTTPGKP